MEDPDFVTQFYNLEGDTISERKKNFFKLLKAQCTPLTEEDLKDLYPRTYMEKLFEVDIFIHFNLSTKLLNVIKGGNPVLVSKILNYPLSLKTAIGDVSPGKFVVDFLPYTSYSLRMKILKKISFFLEESQMDEIIYWVHKRYGFNIAIKLLHTCSSKKIKEFLDKYEIMLKPRQIKLIFDKDPELFEVYLRYHKQLTKQIFNHNNICKYVAHKNPDMWLKLRNENLISWVKLGRRTSRYIIHRENSDVLKNVEYYSKYLKLRVIVQELHENYKEVYFRYFPKNISDLSTNNFCFKLAKFYSKEKQWDLFEQAFMEIHQKNILDNLLYLNFEFFKMLPNKIIKNKWAEIHYENDQDKPNSRLKYCDTNKAIPLIKEKINVTLNIHQRNDLVKLLVENCRENNDLIYLENVLEYIWVEHRNEDVIFYILDTVNASFNLEDLEESHWNHINKILAFLRLHNRSHYTRKSFILKYIEFLILHDKPFRIELTAFLEGVVYENILFNITELKNPEVKKQILLETFNILYTSENELRSKLEIDTFIMQIIDFNEDHTEHAIDISRFPVLVDRLESIFDKGYVHETWGNSHKNNIFNRVVMSNLKDSENPLIKMKESQILKALQESNLIDYFSKIIKKAIMKHNRSEFENNILHLFWDKYLTCSYISTDVINWFFSNEPKILIPYIDEILKVDKYCFNFEKVKLMSHLDFDKKIIDYCCIKLHDFIKETESIKGNRTIELEKGIIEVLSTLLPINKYIELVEKLFIPINGKMETADETLDKLYLLQCRAVESFKRTLEPVTVLPTIMKFCFSDYMKSALPSLYSVCYVTPENELHSYIDELSKREVSVKQHALFLSCELLDFNSAVNTLRSINENSILCQKHVFSSTLKYFRKNPCMELLNMVVKSLNKISKNDLESLKQLVNTKVPKKYTKFYVLKCWHFLESLGEDINIQKYLRSCLKSITSSEDIIVSSPDLCKRIITSYFNEKEEKSLPNIYRFIITVLRYQKSKAINFIFDILTEFKEKNQIKPIQKLFNTFYSIALEDIKQNIEIITDNNYYYIELFEQRWYNTFTSTEMFDEHFLLHLLHIKYKSSSNIEKYAQDVILYLEELVAEYSLHVYNKVKKLIIKHSYAPKDKYLFFYNVLKFKNSTFNCILILELLEESKESRYSDKDFCNKDDVKDFLDKIMKILETSNDPIVTVYLNSYINNN